MLRGYDLNPGDEILKDEESSFPMNHLNPRVQHLDSFHNYLHPHHAPPHFLGVRRGSSASPADQRQQPRAPVKLAMADPLSQGVSLKPIYLPRPSVVSNGSHHLVHSPSNESGRLISQSLYPYNLARLSPSERSRVFYQKRIPGGANILVNDAWMVLPFDSVRRSSCYSCSSSTRDECPRRHSCPVADASAEDTTLDRGSSSSRDSRDSYTNNNSRNESNYNHLNKHRNKQQAQQQHNSTKRTSKIIEDQERIAAAPKSSDIVRDVTDTKL